MVDFSINGLSIMSDILELGRMVKRSLDGYITHRKAGAILIVIHGHTDKADFLSYIDNGYIGLSVSPSSNINIKSKRTLSIPVHFKPLVSEAGVREEEAVTVTDYLAGTVTHTRCITEAGSVEPVTVTSVVYTHRTMPGLLMQDINTQPQR